MSRNTPCECLAPGLCERHRCLKPEALFQICRRDQSMFQAWEAGIGPCFPGNPETEEAETGTQMPSLGRQIMNFSSASIRHAVNRFRVLDDNATEKRLAICRKCPACDLEHMICREQSCGCYLLVKSRWASERCPRDQWPIAVEDDETEFPASNGIS